MHGFPHRTARRADREPVSSAAALDHPTAAQIRRLAEAKLAAPETDVDPAAIAAAATAMQVEASRWARLRVGEELSYDWPAGTPAGPNRVVPAAGRHGTMNARPAELIEPVRHRAPLPRG